MSINSNLKLINEIKTVSNNLKEVILKQTISNSKLIELESGLSQSLDILNKLNINMENDDYVTDKESKLMSLQKMVSSHHDFFL